MNTRKNLFTLLKRENIQFHNVIDLCIVKYAENLRCLTHIDWVLISKLNGTE